MIKKSLFWQKMYFFQQNEPHTTKLRISAVFKQFYAKRPKKSHFGQKSVFLIKMSHTAFLLFLKHFLRKLTKKFSFWSKKCFAVLKHFFRNSPKTYHLVQKSVFSHQNEPYTATLSYYADLKNFYGKWLKRSIFIKKKEFFSAKWATSR